MCDSEPWRFLADGAKGRASRADARSQKLSCPETQPYQPGISEVASCRGTLLKLIDFLEIVEITSLVLELAARPMPTQLGALTPFIWRGHDVERISRALSW